MTGLKKRDSCRDAFRWLGVLTVTLLYLLEEIRSTNTIPNFVHRPQDWLWVLLCLNLWVLCFSIKVWTTLRRLVVKNYSK
ncbi:hypothetical protein J6590_077475 [Homalodisca vitripennis]|nr:hypothetical protein J6590_077475 [Homalodisca vitripennis]